jgi:hypothetical protein
MLLEQALEPAERPASKCSRGCPWAIPVEGPVARRLMDPCLNATNLKPRDGRRAETPARPAQFTGVLLFVGEYSVGVAAVNHAAGCTTVEADQNLLPVRIEDPAANPGTSVQ